MMDSETVLAHYLRAAIWTDTDEDETPFDETHTVEDFHVADKENAIQEIENFIAIAGNALENLSPEQTGHDFWLTRNGHGAGFWDRGLGEIGETLTKIAQTFPERHVFNDENGLYFS